MMRHLAAVVLLATCLAVSPGRALDDDPASTARLEWELLEAETALGQDEPRIAASHYRAAVREAWFLLGLIAVEDGELETARDALERSRNAAAVGLGRARVALALVELRLGEVERPLRELRFTTRENLEDIRTLRLFVEALRAAGQEEEYRAELEELRQLDAGAAAEIEEAISSAEHRAPLPATGSLGETRAEDRAELRARLVVSLVHAHRNLAALKERTGFDRGRDELLSAAEELETAHPEARNAFGKVDLETSPRRPKIHPPRLDLVRLITSSPAPLHTALGLLDRGDVEGAKAELRRQLEGSDGLAARVLLGRLLAQEGETGAAEEELLAALEISAELPAAHQSLARIYWRDRRAEALDHLRRAAEIAPLDRDLALVLAEAELAEGRSSAAEGLLRSVEKRFDSAEAAMARVAIARRAGSEKEALEAAEKAWRLAPNCEEVLLTHTRLALEAGIVPSAERSVEPLVRMRPEVAEYRFLLGRVWQERRKMGEASEAYLKAVELDPDYLPAFLPLGLALNHESRYPEARGYLERYLEAHPDDLDASSGLAEAEERLGEVEAAERRALAVLEQDPDHARAHLVIGLVRASHGEFAEARAAFERAIGADPLLAKAHYQLSLACARLGDRDGAARHMAGYRKALEGPEAAFVEMQPAKPQMMRKQKGSGGDSRP